MQTEAVQQTIADVVASRKQEKLPGRMFAEGVAA